MVGNPQNKGVLQILDHDGKPVRVGKCGFRWKIYSRDRVWIAIDNPKGLVPAMIAGEMLFYFIAPATKYVKPARRHPGRVGSGNPILPGNV
jgi:hypothetical protein